MYIPSEMIMEIVNRIPKKYYVKVSLINKVFYKKVQKRILNIKSKNQFKKACRAGDYSSLSKLFPLFDTHYRTMCSWWSLLVNQFL